MKHVIANLKMNFVSQEECEAYLQGLKDVFTEETECSVTICPSTLYIDRFAAKIPKGLLLGAQNAFWESRGSFTGETSCASLRNAGVHAVICGHSERRAQLGETDVMIARKMKTIVESGMVAVLCVGETTEERDAEETALVVTGQLEEALGFIDTDRSGNIVVAYEPRWAIGSGATPETEDIMRIRIAIRRALMDRYGSEGERIPILYGGSVNAESLKEVCVDADMDGVLVGRESLDPRALFSIVKRLSEDGAQERQG